MKLIVGLGNPDKKYENTFHNLGFACADRVADILGASFSKEKFRALVAEKGTGKDKIIIAKPQTYMNLSGESVREIVAFYKIPLNDMLLLFDDYDLEKGMIRIREKGSAGTHNGVKSVIKELGSENIPRLKIGFKPDKPIPISLIDLVLSAIPQEDARVFSDALNRGAEAAVKFAQGEPLSALTSKYNGKN